MSTVHVEAARIPDRDRLLFELQEAGLRAHAVDEVEIVVDCTAEDEPEVSHEVYEQVERLIVSIGAPFVPTKHEGVIYIRPPVG